MRFAEEGQGMHTIDLPAWAIERVNIDMQNVFVAEGEVYANPHARDIIPVVNRLSGALRAAGAAVIWTRQTHAFDGPYAVAPWQYDLSRADVRAAVEAMQAGAASQALHPEMSVHAGDTVVD